MIPSIDDWKKLSDADRSAIIADTEMFNPYSNEAYDLVRDVGHDFVLDVDFEVMKIGVANRFGELVIDAYVEEDLLPHARISGPKKHLGFRIFYGDIRSWFEH